MTVRGLAAVGSPQPIAQGIEHLFQCITKILWLVFCLRKCISNILILVSNYRFTVFSINQKSEFGHT